MPLELSTEVIISDSGRLYAPLFVPEKRYVPEIVSALTTVSSRPSSTTLQLEPLFVERKTPKLLEPAKRFVPETARLRTFLYVNPELAAVQLVPLSVDRKRLSPPAKRYVPETAKHRTHRPPRNSD